MVSYWERTSLIDTDIAIVGSGIVGLSVAASLAERKPDLKITVLERSVLPYGASTRNAGFACFGSLTELLHDIKVMGEEACRDLVFSRWMGLQITRKRLGDSMIGFKENGGFELLSNTDAALDQMGIVNGITEDFIPNYIQESSDKIQAFGLQTPQQTMVCMNGEGQVDTGKLMCSMLDYVQKLGVRILTGAQVEAIEDKGQSLILNDASRGPLTMKAGNTVICTNAFASSLVETDLEPGRGQVFITEPIEGLKFSGNLHLDEGFYYLRNVGERLLFGGARNLDFETERSIDFVLNEEIQKHLEEKLKSLFDYKNLSVADRWSGIMAFGKDKKPLVQQTAAHTTIAIKMGGMGIALAGFIGEEVADRLV